jgi:hypothetical protein
MPSFEKDAGGGRSKADISTLPAPETICAEYRDDGVRVTEPCPPGEEACNIDVTVDEAAAPIQNIAVRPTDIVLLSEALRKAIALFQSQRRLPSRTV